MSGREWKRIDVVKRVANGLLTTAEAALVLGLCPRQVRRIRRALEEHGQDGVRHGNKGRPPPNRRQDDQRARVLELFKTKYAGFNDQHFTEKLVDVEKIKVSRPTVQRWLRAAGLTAARKRRAPKHRRRRDRKPQAGLMILWDGSRHAWLEDRGPMMCLMGAVDDATSELLPGAHFVDQECAAGYLATLRAIVRAKGVPCSAYMDRHGSLRRNDDNWTLEEELRGEQAEKHAMSKKATAEFLGDFVDLLVKHLKKGNKVRVTGLGIFQVKKRPARLGRNPLTGEQIKIKASKKLAFRAAKEVKESI